MAVEIHRASVSGGLGFEKFKDLESRRQRFGALRFVAS